MFVASDKIQNLLILQDRQLSVKQLQSEIERLPQEIQKLEGQIAEENAALEAENENVKQLEVARSELELEVRTAEEQVAKYKTQQLQVKKNDEYKALTQQIEDLESKIGDLETSELEVMETIDEAKEVLRKNTVEIEKRIAYQGELIGECHSKLENLKSRLEDSEIAYREQTKSMDAAEVALFEKLIGQVRRVPYVVPVSNQNCGGCHMRVSNDAYQQAKMGQLARCDQCSRILYFEKE